MHNELIGVYKLIPSLDPEKIKDFPKTDSFDIFKEYINQMKKTEEECLKNVLREILKREPTLQDFKDCTMIFPEEGNQNKYYFMHLGICYGFVTKEIIDYTFEVTFDPERGIPEWVRKAI